MMRRCFIFTSTPSLKTRCRGYRFGLNERASEKTLESFLPGHLNRGLDYADYESDIVFFIRTKDGPERCTWVPHCGYMRHHGT
jgi:hypothetical protein